MILFENKIRKVGIQFDNYLESPGFSHSSIKMMRNGVQRDFITTDKVRIGKIVDDILTNPKVNHEDNPLYNIARDIADKMIVEYGSLLKYAKYQSSYFGDMIDLESGLFIHIKGRPDCEFVKKIIIDYKVTDDAKNERDCHKLIEFMGYDNQLWNYGKLADADNHFLFIYSRKAKRTFTIKRLTTNLDRDLAENWWTNKILEHGSYRTT